MNRKPLSFGHLFTALTVILFLLLAAPMLSHAQEDEPNPVSWTFTSKKLGKNIYELQFMARIDSSWRIYSPSGVYFPTVIKINTHPQVTLKGRIKEAGRLAISTDKFDKGAKFLTGLVNFKQMVIVKPGSPITVTGNIRYAATDGKLMLGYRMVEFSIMIGNK